MPARYHKDVLLHCKRLRGQVPASVHISTLARLEEVPEQGDNRTMLRCASTATCCYALFPRKNLEYAVCRRMVGKCTVWPSSSDKLASLGSVGSSAETSCASPCSTVAK